MYKLRSSIRRPLRTEQRPLWSFYANVCPKSKGSHSLGVQFLMPSYLSDDDLTTGNGTNSPKNLNQFLYMDLFQPTLFSHPSHCFPSWQSCPPTSCNRKFLSRKIHFATLLGTTQKGSQATVSSARICPIVSSTAQTNFVCVMPQEARLGWH